LAFDFLFLQTVLLSTKNIADNFGCLIIKEGFTIAIKELQINEEIRDKEIRVISAEGEQLGVMSPSKAVDIAYEKNLDLVKIAPQAQPPVCKIMDYGKYKFELAKREKENRKNQKTMNIKEVQLSPSIDTNDFNTKCKNAIKFLKNGDKVKVTVRFRGREVSHSEIGEALLIRFAETAKEAGNMEHPPKLEGRNMTMFLVPVIQ
jgi:translation initiation factor IF-3